LSFAIPWIVREPPRLTQKEANGRILILRSALTRAPLRKYKPLSCAALERHSARGPIPVFADRAMLCRNLLLSGGLASLLFGLSGCASPYYADQGALAGGLGGAGLGAIIGSASGAAGPGAVIGAVAGTLAGGAIGSGLDDIDAKNRAQIAAATGQPRVIYVQAPPPPVYMQPAYPYYGPYYGPAYYYR
jgi:hypothetical protein